MLKCNLLSSLNKGSHDRNRVWIRLVLNSINLYDFISTLSYLVMVLIKKVYQTLNTVHDYISKHLEVRDKYCFTRGIFESVLVV